jgi:hypothetical protein
VVLDSRTNPLQRSLSRARWWGCPAPGRR